MRVGSLFSGYAGLDLAVEQVFGAEPAWFVEYDAAPSKILAHHYPNIPNYGDVTTVDWASVPPIDILTGGYPCQPFSAAGQRKGTDDERHLWPYVREAIRVLRPRFAILENVAGHRSLGLDRVLGDMAEDGMRVWWTSIRASDVGAPHHRERVFILAEPANAAGLGWDGREDQRGGGWEASIRREAFDRPADGRGPRAGVSGTDTPAVVLPTPRAMEAEQTYGAPGARRHVEAGNGGLTEVLSVYLPTPTVGNATGTNERRGGVRGGEMLLPGVAVAAATGELLPTPNASDSTGGGQHPSKREGHSRQLIDYALVDAVEWGKYAPAIHRWEALTRPAPAPTEPNRNGRRRLAATFAEWMMGLPAGWVTDPAIWTDDREVIEKIRAGFMPATARRSQLKAIGNGVCPPQAVAAIRELLELRRLTMLAGAA